MSQPLFLLYLPIDLRALARFATQRNRGVVSYRRNGRERDAGLDDGRALHHLLGESFGAAALQPFRLMAAPGAQKGTVYAYTHRRQEDLQQTVRETGIPEASGILDFDQMHSREVPTEWPIDRRLAFDIRIRPSVRIRGALSNPREPLKPYGAGAELDAYFVEAQRRFPDERPKIVNGHSELSRMEREGRTRDVVYREWLAARLMPAAEIDTASVTLQHFERTRVARQGHAPEGPDATLHGELTVKDPSAFNVALAKGVGRHKAYGFGMLMLRPARQREAEF